MAFNPDSCGGDVWNTVKEEASRMCDETQKNIGGTQLRAFLEAAILKWKTLEESLAAHLAVKLSRDPRLSADEWGSLLTQVFLTGSDTQGESISSLIRADLRAIKERDVACPSLVHAMLYFKGFQALQLYRAAHFLWNSENRPLASLIQSIVSEIFGLDIHPGAKIGKAVLLDHGTGVVIGETAVIGSGCTLLHAVTLGATGKDSGNRHPKLGSDVLVGVGASILGNITIGDGAKIGASSVVLKDIPSHATAVGIPAKVRPNVAVLRVASKSRKAIFKQKLFAVARVLGYLKAIQSARALDQACRHR